MQNAPVNSFEEIMGGIVALVITAVFFFLLVRAYWIWHANRSRPEGVTTAKKATLFDVRELLLKGEKDQAIRVYRQVFRVDREKAQAAVNDLERNLHNQG